MKYSLEIVNGECIETFEIENNHGIKETYQCRYQRTEAGCHHADKDIYEQLQEAGYCEEFIDEYYNHFDTFQALSLFHMYEM